MYFGIPKDEHERDLASLMGESILVTSEQRSTHDQLVVMGGNLPNQRRRCLQRLMQSTDY